MQLTREQFDLLVTYAKFNKLISIEELIDILDYSPEVIKDVNAQLFEASYINDNGITDDGIDALEPYRAKRAILMAAGFGSRMLPVSATTPKPLVTVNGTRIIETLIDALLASGIEEIYIVRGYLAHKFDLLLDKYPNIKFISNPFYDTANSISSILQARELLQNAYLLEADLMLSNPNIIQKYHYCSNFLGIKVDSTDDWCFHMKDNFIDIWKRGGENCYQEVGISYWTADDGSKASLHIRKSFNADKGNDQCWEYPMLVEFKDEYNIEVRECYFEDILEIDTYEDLAKLDNSYIL